MKVIKKILMLVLLVAVIVTSISTLTFTASAASNPYPTSQFVGGVTTIPCTYYAWQQAYDRLGIALPAWGNAINWYNAAANAGYSVGSVPKANSIAVWSSSQHSYGHVGFVTSVSSNGMTVNEGGRTDAAGNGGIVNGQFISATAVGSWWGSRCVVGYIYLDGAPEVSLTWTDYPDKHSIGSTNAVLARKIDMSGATTGSVSKNGIYIYDYNGTELKHIINNSTLQSGYSYFYLWFDMKGELGYTLSPGTTYKYKFMAVVNGKTYYSPVYSFKTTGTHSHKYNSGTVTKNPGCTSTGTRTYTCTTCGGTKTEPVAATGHSYGSWSTTKGATCTTTGTQKRTCSKCGGSETKNINALGHNYSSSWTVDKAATCTVAGSKSHHCTRSNCTAKKDVTSIVATGHSYGSWNTAKGATCTTTGTQKRTCSKCSAYETKTIKAIGHKWGAWQVSVAATTEKAGTEIRKCSNNGCKVTETRSIPKLPTVEHKHSFGEWVVETEAGCETEGLKVSPCSSCSERQTQTIAALGHSFGDWTQTVAPTAEAEGTEERSCSNCTKKEQRSVAKLSNGDVASDIFNSDSKTDTETNTDADGNSLEIEDKTASGFGVKALLIPGAVVIGIGGTVLVALLFRKKKK